jgi:hypothetical protein
MPFQPVYTTDGSLSCLDTETGELCHNSAGAYTEAVNNYVTPSGLINTLQTQGSIRVLDACYGLGYNTWALINELVQCEFLKPPAPEEEHSNYAVSVVAIEQSEEVLQWMPRILEHPTFDALKTKITPREHNIYYRTQECYSNTKEGVPFPQNFAINVASILSINLELWIDDLRTIVPRLSGEFDAVFHDPFSPQKMPELWTINLFREYFRLLSPRQGCLLTYSAAAAVRGGLIEAGFNIAKTQGLGAKGGGTVATIGPVKDHTLSPLLPFDEWELEYISSRAGIPYRDAHLQQSRNIILNARKAEQAASDKPSGSTALKKKPCKTCV